MKLLARIDPRQLAAIVGGLLLAVSYPKPGVAGFAWLAPGLILFAALGQRGQAAFRIGYFAGLTHHLFTLSWLLCIPFPAGAIAGWLALSAYLALYPAIWVWLCWRLFSKTRFTAEQTWRTAIRDFFATGWWWRACWVMLCAALWVALEMIRARLFTGFPWNFLGVSQYRLVPVIQIASVTGVYGVSFLVAWFSVSLVAALLRIAREPGLHRAWWVELRPAIVVLVGVMIFGLNRLLEQMSADRNLTVALVQPSIPQVLIWDHAEDANRFNRIMELSRLALAAKPDLLIWPESSLPNLTEENFAAITNLVATYRVWMILGADDTGESPGAGPPGERPYFNAAFLFSPESRCAATYHKQHLVMFGEYLPLARRLPWLRRIIPIPADFTPGTRPVPFELTEPRTRISMLICFEDVIPDLARQGAGDEVDFLLNLTNDGWFGRSAAQWQQAANAVFRAVENGLPLVRCTNNGLTCWIDSRGRLRDVAQSASGDVYGPGFVIARIPLLPPGKKRGPTFYHRHGDWFGWSCVALVVLTGAFRLEGRLYTSR